MYEEIRSRRLLPESGRCSGRLLLKVHCGALESMTPGVAVVLRNSLALRGSRRLGMATGTKYPRTHGY